MVTGETYQGVWDWVRSAHNPEVAGSNPAPATNVSAGQRPFPIGRGPLVCVARDQIRDQIADQRRLSCPTPSQAKRRIEIRGTYCNGSGHLRRGRRVETQRSHQGPWKIGADGSIVLSSSPQVNAGGRKGWLTGQEPTPIAVALGREGCLRFPVRQVDGLVHHR